MYSSSYICTEGIAIPETLAFGIFFTREILLTMSLRSDDILDYFNARNNRFTNAKGVEMGLTERNEIWSYFSLIHHDYGPLAISISTEGDSPQDFIDKFVLASVDEIEILEYKHSWMRYLNGMAEISITPIDLEATLEFKIVKRKTIIFSLDLHFYDEVYEHLTMSEDFERYVEGHAHRLGVAAANRSRMNRK